PFPKRRCGSQNSGTVDRRNCRLAPVKVANIDGNAARGDLSDMTLKERTDSLRLLVRNKTHGDLRGRGGRKNRLGSFAGKAAPDAVAFQRGPGPEPLKRRIPFLAVKSPHAQFFRISLVVPRELLVNCAFLRRQLEDVVVKTR